ncbi:hypothetical protein PHYSODRAFT_332858 [Phytophthora sojae]|uniref:Uncharacterized protein n=1 Tax=Phytophthora sojae (strain P6497) TaxID=1094619 RepID=G4ZJY8_PHYSP|nr:hypothetical protein PHYSODRAFT_332858 [Phytophthora sojae]EGZ14470.1 hypothetical protein PHYSODRAFT_332858 [Phytophthora sojae]|eukprot:XP_009528219.1 hypothetical protein PHYSODRAFT_332858 [Phytophthora sojae]
MPVATADVDVPKRLSFVSAGSQTKGIEDGYMAVKTPEIEGGAIREGGMQRQPRPPLPFQGLLRHPVRLSTHFGYRRRPYMLIGWGICFIMLLIMAIMPIGKPYFTVSSDRDIKVADYTPEIEARINHSALVELAQVGNEAAVYSLVTTVSNVAQPFATSITLAIDGPFDVSNERVQADTHSVRSDITYTMYSMTIFSWVFLFLLPPQKAETQELVRKGGHSKIIGGATVFYLVFAIIWSIMTSIMAMSTARRV